VCSDHGNCIDLDVCICECMYYEDNCQYRYGRRKDDDDDRSLSELRIESRIQRRICKEKKYWKHRCMNRFNEHCRNLFKDEEWLHLSP